MSDEFKKNQEIDKEMEHISNIIRKALNVNYIGDSSSEIARKQFNDEKETIKSIYENIIKDKCVELGIDPDSIKIDWGSVKLDEEL